ncbi:MAG: hypothetical protein ACFFER_06075, partial [Candidatus Thorarchaeota archaeon]
IEQGYVEPWSYALLSVAKKELGKEEDSDRSFEEFQRLQVEQQVEREVLRERYETWRIENGVEWT